MIRKSIVNIWRDAPSAPTGEALQKLLADRSERVRTQLRLKPISALDPMAFADFLLISKVNRHRTDFDDCGGGDFESDGATRRQVLHVLKSRYCMNPEAVLQGNLDDIARQIARRIEDALDDALWEAA
jgi:hypothetical protein